MAKGAAHPSLLSTYTEERLPIIAQMLSKTTKIYRSVAQSSGAQRWTRGKEIKQLGINYRWSSIVFDERDPEGALKEPEDVYGIEAGDSVRGGDRAPDAPGLVPVESNESSAGPTSLFRIFSPTYHTVLIFSTSSELIASVQDLLKGYPSDLIRTVLIYPQGHGDTAASHGKGVDIMVVDRDGHAYGGYRVMEEGIKIVVVRPDGVIGGMVFGSDGLKKYFERVISAVTKL